MKSKERRKHQFVTESRQRAHDVVIYQEGGYNPLFDESVWCVYDAVTDKTERFDNEHEALELFKRIKRQFKDARLI